MARNWDVQVPARTLQGKETVHVLRWTICHRLASLWALDHQRYHSTILVHEGSLCREALWLGYAWCAHRVRDLEEARHQGQDRAATTRNREIQRGMSSHRNEICGGVDIKDPENLGVEKAFEARRRQS